MVVRRKMHHQLPQRLLWKDAGRQIYHAAESTSGKFLGLVHPEASQQVLQENLPGSTQHSTSASPQHMRMRLMARLQCTTEALPDG
jgi:hypothetical protein